MAMKHRTLQRLSRTIIWNKKQGVRLRQRRRRRAARAVKAKAEAEIHESGNLSSMHNTPVEIWREIFFYFPVKTLVRSRLVSKLWKSVIEEPNFISSHLLRASTNNTEDLEPSLIVKEADSRWSVRCSKTFEETTQSSSIKSPTADTKMWTVTGARDGVFLFRKDSLLRRIDDDTLILWNPSIQKSVHIAQSPLLPLSEYSHSRNVTILGFDPSEHDYKLVTIVDDETISPNNLPPTLPVFSLNRSSWAEVCYSVIGTPPNGVIHLYRVNISVGEYIHWMGMIFDPESSVHAYILVSLNLITMTISYTQLPEQELDLRYPVLIRHGCLLGLLTDRRMWVLDGLQDCARWNKMYETEEKILDHRDYLYLTKDGLFLSRGMKSIYVYDLKTGQRTKFRYPSVLSPDYIDAHVESLVLLTA